MWTGHPAGGTDFANGHPALNRITDGHVHFTQMCVQRQESKAMIDDDDIAGEEIIADVNDSPGGSRENGSTFWCREIHSTVGIS